MLINHEYRATALHGGVAVMSQLLMALVVNEEE